MSFFIPSSIYELIGAVSSLAVIILTIYTFYLTKISNRFDILSKGNGNDAWEGYNCFMTLRNKTLHDISILEIGVLYQDNEGKYWNVSLSKFNEGPMIIKPFEVKKFESNRHQRIQINKLVRNIDMFDNNNIFYFYIGNKTIFIPVKKMSISKCNSIYKKVKYNQALVFRNTVFFNEKEINVDLDVKYIVHIKDSSNEWKSFLLNNKGMISGSLNGFNAFPEIANLKNEDEIGKIFIKTFNINNDIVRIERINHLITSDIDDDTE